jgi:hypothetical protein
MSGQTSRNVFEKMRILRRLQCICAGEPVDELTFTEMIVSAMQLYQLHACISHSNRMVLQWTRVNPALVSPVLGLTRSKTQGTNHSEPD